MTSLINEKTLISEAREVLLLLDAGKAEEAIVKIRQFDAQFQEQDTSSFETDVLALWAQVKIAANDPSDVKYFEDVKEELNRVTFEYTQKHPL